MLRNNPALKFCDIDDVTEESTHGSALFFIHGPRMRGPPLDK